jgi:hypothetical protein
MAVVVAAGVGPPVRPVVVLWFLAAAPGLALVPLLRLGDRLGEIVLVLALSVGCDLAVALLLFWLDAWTLGAALTVLAAVCVAGAVAQLVVLRSAVRTDA